MSTYKQPNDNFPMIVAIALSAITIGVIILLNL